jgi:dTDP-4-dehydrorhamnose 3,5-epimerase
MTESAGATQGIVAQVTVETKFRIKPLEIPEVFLIIPNRVTWDSRGVFTEFFRATELMDAIPSADPVRFVQSNFSRSRPYVLRGLHYQHPRPQGKLVQIIQGKIFDVAIDLRRHSPTFGKHCTAILDEMTPCALYVPPGFAHGFMTFELGASVVYMTTSYHNPAYDRAIRWDDPTLDIRWPIGHGANLTMSAKDRNAARFDVSPAYDDA